METRKMVKSDGPFRNSIMSSIRRGDLPLRPAEERENIDRRFHQGLLARIVDSKCT